MDVTPNKSPATRGRGLEQWSTILLTNLDDRLVDPADADAIAASWKLP
ncbi:MAG: hypothetical protein R3E58_01330 [Phycisphaerae bacterium]